MANGSFRTPEKSGRYISVDWSSQNDTDDNASVISWTAYAHGSQGAAQYVAAIVRITIDGTQVYATDYVSTEIGQALANGEVRVAHETNGTRVVAVAIEAQIKNEGNYTRYSGTIEMTPNPVYNLTLTEGQNSYIVVRRTSCAGPGSTGHLVGGDKVLYDGDELEIEFAASPGYYITTTEIKGTFERSTDTHIVIGNVRIRSAAAPYVFAELSLPGEFYINTPAAIQIERSESRHNVEIQYSFCGADGTIYPKQQPQGGLITQLEWLPPAAFYDKIPNQKNAEITITCKTYAGNTLLGTKNYTRSVWATGVPLITASIKENDAVAFALAGNAGSIEGGNHNGRFIRHLSSAKITVSATASGGAQIQSLTVNNGAINFDQNYTVAGTSGDTYKEYSGAGEIVLQKITQRVYVVRVVDTRGYTRSTTLEIPASLFVPYIPLTLTADVYRPSDGSSTICARMRGNFYSGHFAGNTNQNQLFFRYRYRQVGDPTWGAWLTCEVSPSTTNNYYDTGEVQLPASDGDFDYQKGYDFGIAVRDGMGAEGFRLPWVQRTVNVPPGIPVFDWGKDDFEFHVPVKISGEGASLTIGGVELTSNSLGDIIAGDAVNVPDISTDVFTDRNSHTKTVSPKAVYDYCSGLPRFWYGTRAEYNALPSSERLAANVIHLIQEGS